MRRFPAIDCLSRQPYHFTPDMDSEALARELLSAQESGHMVSVPPSSRPGFDLQVAYEVEAALKRSREAAGHRSVGRKVGYANKALWRMLKLETLVWAHMYDHTVHHSTGNSFTLALPAFRSLKVEPEIVFCLKRAWSAESADAAAALEAVEWLAIGFEVIDCPYPGWQFQPGDFVASFGLHAALVIGERMPVHGGERMPVRGDQIAKLADDLARFKVRILKDGEFVEEGSAKNALRNPALCLAELGRAALHHSPPEPLTAGEVISTGTLTAGHPAKRDDLWTVEVEGLGLPPLALRIG
jgi:2-keto-4-pentenoate hydratase